jgi:drug/metabolite transporter (DMT)-like permease
MAWGIEHSSASNASILSLTIPVLMMLMGMVMLKERPGRFVLFSLALAMVGTALISWDDIAAGNFSGRTLTGNIAVFLSGAGAAFYNAYCKKLLERHSAVQILVYGYIAAIVLCAAISICVDPLPFYAVAGWSMSAWIAIVVLGALVWGAAMLLWLWLLNQLELGQISVSVYMLPVFGVLLSAATLGEHVGVMQLAGGTIVLLSAYFSSAPPAEVGR